MFFLISYNSQIQVVNNERYLTMEGNLDHPIAPTGIVKDEPLDEPNLEGDQEECSEDIIESLRAYLPLPHGVKEESPLEDDGHDEFNSGVQVNLSLSLIFHQSCHNVTDGCVILI